MLELAVSLGVNRARCNCVKKIPERKAARRAIFLLEIPTMVTFSRAMRAKCSDLERTNQGAVSRVAMTAPLRSNAEATRKKKS